MTLIVDRLAQLRLELLEKDKKISRLEKEKERLFERVCELANDVSTFNLEAYMAVKDLHEVIADLQAS